MSDLTADLTNLEPQPLWEYFDAISRLPRCSKREERVRAWVLEKAAALGLDCREDATGNIAISRPATPGLEEAPGVILQAHLDMVCEKSSSSGHDFDRDPIQLQINGNLLTARETTLGADNGIGVAAALALLAAPDLKAGPLQALFTVDEETGMTGALGLTPDFINGDYLINLDSEESWVICIGCAGGMDSILQPHCEFSNSDATPLLKVEIDGLAGGHSGVDIHTGRGNAVKILAALLSGLGEEMPWQLLELNGGSKHNAIPRQATALLAPADVKKAVGVIETAFARQRDIFQAREEGLVLRLSQPAGDASRLSEEQSRHLIGLLTCLPHGVAAMSAEIPNLVETSSNLAIVDIAPDRGEILLSHRSSSAAALQATTARVREIARAFNATIEQGNGYPAWRPNPASGLLKQASRIYRDLAGEQPEIVSIHAGLECGLIGSLLPHLEMIAIGPTIRNPHTLDELVEIDSVAQFWRFLRRLVTELVNR